MGSLIKTMINIIIGIVCASGLLLCAAGAATARDYFVAPACNGQTSPPYPGIGLADGERMREAWFPVVWEAGNDED